MKVNTIPGASYALTCTAACTVQALFSDVPSLTVLETENSGQYFFIAPADAVEVSDEHALVTQTFKEAAPGWSARGGMSPGKTAIFKNLAAEGSCLSCTDNAGGGILAESPVADGVFKTGLRADGQIVVSAPWNVCRPDHPDGTAANDRGAVSPAGTANRALVMLLFSGVSWVERQLRSGWPGYSGLLTAAMAEKAA